MLNNSNIFSHFNAHAHPSLSLLLLLLRADRKYGDSETFDKYVSPICIKGGHIIHKPNRIVPTGFQNVPLGMTAWFIQVIHGQNDWRRYLRSNWRLRSRAGGTLLGQLSPAPYFGRNRNRTKTNSFEISCDFEELFPLTWFSSYRVKTDSPKQVVTIFYFTTI